MKGTPAVPAGGSESAASGGETPGTRPGEVLDDLTPEQLAAQWEEEKPPAAGALANAASSLVVIGVGLGAVVLSIIMGLGTPATPQPGLWPFIISCVMVALGVFQLLAGRHNRDAEKFTRMSTAPLTGLVTLAAMVALMPLIGFELPALVLCIIWMRFLGGETWRSTLVVSAAVVIAFYAIFVFALNTSIPHLF
ncbi:tripartite tricarboxylate transporter TctB family protein [Arthrobacter sp. CDRTa11]|uniref:tripartite tricarboxylate transporter TctB family protein n=1 Tax=Arthrobacter sp. CDRTa11 TaxID=2651199 RepID=UPI002265B61D|nr:tripartite tricarboxylate transporter TctB family protein [Arthrobacter sp. CDRTa11]UZX01223.1 tripartite tricarboxylate transporter TctB family protein [Arthrobacter sp. CDRTa11]